MQNIVIGKSSHPMIVNKTSGVVVAHSDFEILNEENNLTFIENSDIINI